MLLLLLLVQSFPFGFCKQASFIFQLILLLLLLLLLPMLLLLLMDVGLDHTKVVVGSVSRRGLLVGGEVLGDGVQLGTPLGSPETTRRLSLV